MSVPEIIYADPIGSPFRPVDLDEIVNLLRTHRDDYWLPQNVQALASLTFCPQGWADGLPQPSEVQFFRREGLGFHFYHVHDLGFGKTAKFMAARNLDYSKSISITLANDEQNVFANLFVDIHHAVNIVSQFFIDGGRTGQVAWVDIRSLPPN
ncbi:hypothetical protein [Fimbriiglobus ruber]|uniref:hypothetical protein n=1 Tax=Fimbriiglobus ruber TaxID=1908690 RepID=UPI00117B0ED8|nr:hypothetical protein [Fimbriiglobus ruber]